VEETALDAARKQVVRGAKGDITVALPIDSLSSEGTLHRYYFLFPKMPGKAGARRLSLNTLSAFGPYSSAWAASFIRTSACALGLLEADAVQ